MILAAIGWAHAVSVATEVRHHNMKSLSQSARNFVKARMGLRVAMKH
jgi:hypothetical protein